MFEEQKLSLSSEINALPKQAINFNQTLSKLNIEPIYQGDSHYNAAQESKNDELISLDKFLKL